MRDDIILTGRLIQVEEGDYIHGDNGLLYCGKCGTPKQVKLRAGSGYEQVVNCLCKCRKKYYVDPWWWKKGADPDAG